MAERMGVRSALRRFLKSEASGGIVLMIAAIMAMIVANSALYDSYHHILNDNMGPIPEPGAYQQARADDAASVDQ